MYHSYDLTITNGTIAPDGVEVAAILVDGTFPGPTLEANWGDWFNVTVHNNLPSEGSTLHWHGLLQQNTSYEDGVPGVSQCPIAPGQSYTYTFRADLYGTSWYHSHYSAQYASGAIGPIVIHGPNVMHQSGRMLYDIDKGPVMLSDWYHSPDGYFPLVEQTMVVANGPSSNKTLPPHSDNNLINGKMNFDCSRASPGQNCTPKAGLTKFHLQTNTRYRFRLINSGAEAIQKLSVDGYNLTIIENDFVPVQPYQPQDGLITLGVGQRTDVVLDTSSAQPTDAIWMRSTVSSSCSRVNGNNPGGNVTEALAVIYFQDADTNAVPTTTSTVPVSRINECFNDALSSTVPVYSITPQPPTSTQTINITFDNNGTQWLFNMNGNSFRDDYNDPNLLEAKLGNVSFPADQNVYDFGSNKSVSLVVYNFIPASHPMHMHGHNFYVIDEGFGTWDGNHSGNTTNPQRRDTQLLQKAQADGNGTVTAPSYVVLQFDLDNPGVWPFHCHIAWHVSQGLYINMLERPADINSTQINVPLSAADLCRSWWTWTGSNFVDQIDSGL